jgi:hypothetical protein
MPSTGPFPSAGGNQEVSTVEKYSTSGWVDLSPRWHMSPMFGLLVAWGILTGILVILLIYKSTLTMHEDDSIFLNESESQMHKDQVEVLEKMKKITPIVKVLGALSGVMILVIAGLFIYQGLSNATTLQ